MRAPRVPTLPEGYGRDVEGVYREVRATVTAYCPCARCCGHYADGVTSTGTSAWTPGVASEPLVMPYGTRVFIPGYGVALIDDTGGAMRRSWRRKGEIHLDVRMDFHQDARVWGRRTLKVRVYEPARGE
jgi:3D (Asp-Asp-Asp) domain-containing protein